MKKTLLSLLLLIPSYVFSIGIFDNYPVQLNSSFLPPEEAFDYSYKSTDNKIKVQWIIPENYYMYKDRLFIKSNGVDVPVKFKTEHVQKFDENFDKEMNIYYEVMEIEMDKSGHNNIEIKYQGCAEAGLCYTPQVKIINVNG